MGLEPPEEYRVLGPGIDEYVAKYRYFRECEDYHEYDAGIPGYEYDVDPDEGPRNPVPSKAKPWRFDRDERVRGTVQYGTKRP